MKKSILTVASMALIMSLQAQAKTTCIVAKENPQDENSFDQTVFKNTVESRTSVIIERDGTIVKGLDIESLAKSVKTSADFEKLKQEYDQSEVVVMTPQEDNRFGIATAHFDFSKQSNLLPSNSFAGGAIDKELVLVDSGQHLSVVCRPK